MNYSDLQKECAAALEAAGIANFKNESRWLVLETAGVPATVLYGDVPASDEHVALIRELCCRRCSHEPLQYLLGSAPFAELELSVSPAVLIPRSETVCLVEHAIDTLPVNGVMLDVGCGSGAIALLAAFRRPDITVVAVDKSPQALEVARRNCADLGLSDRVQFFESDLLSGVKHLRFNAIAANLPYVSCDEYAALEDDVRCYEPEMALTAPDDGMALISRLIIDAPEFLLPGASIVLEMSPWQTARACGELKQHGYENIQTFPDQFGKLRFVAAQRQLEKQ